MNATLKWIFKNIYLVALALILVFAAMSADARERKRDREINYVGGGRYVCSGRDCDGFNARKAEMDRLESRIRAEKRRDEINRSIERRRERMRRDWW